MSALPAPMRELPGASTLATERVGDAEALALYGKTVIQLAKEYAKEYDLPWDHTDVSVICVRLAHARKTEMALLFERERALERDRIHDKCSYAESLAKAVRSDKYRRIDAELDRLSGRSLQFHKHLRDLVERLKGTLKRSGRISL